MLLSGVEVSPRCRASLSAPDVVPGDHGLVPDTLIFNGLDCCKGKHRRFHATNNFLTAMLLIMKQGSEGESRPKMQSRNLSFYVHDPLVQTVDARSTVRGRCDDSSPSPRTFSFFHGNQKRGRASGHLSPLRGIMLLLNAFPWMATQKLGFIFRSGSMISFRERNSEE